MEAAVFCYILFIWGVKLYDLLEGLNVFRSQRRRSNRRVRHWETTLNLGNGNRGRLRVTTVVLPDRINELKDLSPEQIEQWIHNVQVRQAHRLTGNLELDLQAIDMGLAIQYPPQEVKQKVNWQKEGF